MFSKQIHSTIFVLLVVLAVFNAASAVGGGIAVISDVLGIPHSVLKGSPFDSFTVPGIVLVVIVGGTQLAAAVLLLRRRDSGLLWSAIAGCGMLIWIFVEVTIIGGGAWLQTVYFVSGLVQLVLVFALLGVVTWLPHVSLTAPKVRS